MDRPARARLVAPVVAAASAAAATAVLAARDPHASGAYGFCPLLALTGLACPLCGGLRATYHLAHLDVAGAWADNPLWVLAVPVLVALWAAWLVRAARGRPAPRVPAVAGWTALAALVVFGIARNLPYLAPYLAAWPA